jgi:iron complex outermembrane receptor protein
MAKLFRSLLAVSAVVFVAPLAQAQVEEITVSAERKDENLQEVPIAVSAFSTTDLQKLQVDLAMDIGAAVPSMQTYAVTANGAAMQVFLRGAGIQNPGFNASESPVGIYVDNIYRGRLATANLDLTDIERIEVLRGPQGTLYGRNTIAGAMKVITRTPEEETWANVALGFGNFQTSKLTASAGGQIADGWGASLAGMLNERDEGWITRGPSRTGAPPLNAPISDKPLGEYENEALRGKINFFGSDVFGATLAVGYVKATNDGYNGIPYGPNYNNPPSSPGESLQGFYDTLVPDSTTGYGKTKQLNTSLDLSWQLKSFSITSITGYSQIEDQFGFDLNGGANDFGGGVVQGVPGLYLQSDSDTDTLSQEFVFQGQAFSDSLDWIGGVFYMNEKGEQLYNPALSNAFAPTPNPLDEITENIKTDTKSYAVYAEGTWNFTDAWSATLGGRWTRDVKKFSEECSIVSAISGFDFPSCYDLTFTPTDWQTDLDKTFEEFTPRALVQYQMNEGTSFYGSFSKGFQAGGFQTLCFGFQACVENIYDPQKVDSYELGAKTEFFDRTLRTNAAVFYADYKDMQQTGILPVGVFPVVNVGDASVTGLELEMNWVPTDGINTFLIGAYADDNISSEAQANLPPSNEGHLPGLPETTLRVGGDWHVGLARTNSWDFPIGADVNYVGEYYATINNSLLVPSYTRVNGFIGFDQPGGSWSIVLRGKNLSDSKDYVSGIVGGGTNIRTPLPPREYMLTVGYKYGG